MAIGDKTMIDVRGVSKIFRLPHEKRTSVKSVFINMFRKQKFTNQQALQNITFEVKEGEFVGIVGRNGSGKSTLLKILAGIYVPTKGDVKINGSLTPFIELGVGFNPELTGRENVFMNGALFGFSRKQMYAMYQEIVDFAELHDFMDQKLKNYSSGMQVRLAFSIAIRSRSDILLLDEVLAVGDAAFQKKCFNYFRDAKAQNKTVVLVTHDMRYVREFCDRAVLIESSEVQFVGDPNEAASRYLLITEGQGAERQGESVNKEAGIELGEVTMNRKKNVYTPADEVGFKLDYKITKPLEYQIGISIIKDGTSLHERSTKDLKLASKPGKYSLEWTAPAKDLNSGMHYINVAAFTESEASLIAYVNNANKFMIQEDRQDIGGLMNMHSQWHVAGK